MAVVLTSTTSPQSELDHAVSDNWREVPTEESVPAPVQEIEPGAPPEEVPEEVAPTEEATKEEAKAAKPKDHKSGFQKRIDKLVARNHALESRLAELESKSKPAEEAKPQPAADNGPKLADYQTPEEWANARDQWKANEEQRTAELERRKGVVDSYNEKVSKARAEYDDWDEVVSGSTKVLIPQAAIDAVIELENGPDVAYYLAQHPEEAEALLTMSPIRTIQVIGKLSDKVAAERAPAPPKPKAKAPEPIAPVGASATRGNIPLDQLSPRDYIRIRNKQERESKRY